jgi:CHASE3 domain sensor protein
MTKNSMAGLSERLQQQLKDDQQAVINQTSALLKQHAQGLQKLSEAALNTTKGVIQRQNQAIDEMHSKTLQRLRWLMMWPLLASICLGVMIVAGASLWSWWKLGQVDDRVQQAQRKINQIRQIEAEFCASPAGQRVCKKG